MLRAAGRRLWHAVAPHSLGRRIVTSVALGLALILLLFGLVALWTVQASTEAAYRERVALAQALVWHVDGALGYALATLEREAGELHLEPGQPLSEEQAGHLADLRAQVGSFALLSLADATGATMWADPARSDLVIGTTASHPSVQRVLQTGQSQVTEFVAQVQGEPVFACVAVPVRDGRGQLSGALMAEIDPGHAPLSLLPTGEVGEAMHVHLVNADGQVLAGSEGLHAVLGQQGHQGLLADLMAARTPGYRIHQPTSDSEPDDHVVAYAPVPRLPSWGVVVEQPKDVVLATPRALQWRLGIFGLLALVAAGTVAWFDTRRVVRPLHRLTVAAQRFTAGNLEEPVQLNRADELGILARAFDTMRQRLRASLAEVAEWNRSALLDPGRVVALVARRARELIGTDAAGLSLLDEERGELTWRFLVGEDAELRHLRVQPGEGLAGAVMQAGRPVVIGDWDETAGGVPADPVLATEGLRSAVAVPLQSAGRTFGVLVVGNRVATAFSDEQVALLSSLANQAAVALENARLSTKVQSLAVLEERVRIAREMHDGFAQVLGYVNTSALAVGRLLERGKVDEARAHVAQLEVAAKEVYSDVREGILGLRTTLEPGQGLAPALRAYLEGFGQQSGVAAELVGPSDPRDLRLPFEAEVQLLRIVQEALTNVRKHARAARATVRLSQGDGVLQLVVEDDGRGFDAACLAGETGRHFGLQTMRERAEAIGGSFTVDSQAGTGTRVTVRVRQQARGEVLDAVDARAPGR